MSSCCVIYACSGQHAARNRGKGLSCFAHNFDWVRTAFPCMPLRKLLAHGVWQCHQLVLTLLWVLQEGITEGPGWWTLAALHTYPSSPHKCFIALQEVCCAPLMQNASTAVKSCSAQCMHHIAPRCGEANPGTHTGGLAKQCHSVGQL